MYCSEYQYSKFSDANWKKHSLIISVQTQDCNCHLCLNGRDSLYKLCTVQPWKYFRYFCLIPTTLKHWCSKTHFPRNATNFCIFLPLSKLLQSLSLSLSLSFFLSLYLVILSYPDSVFNVSQFSWAIFIFMELMQYITISRRYW